MSASAQTTSRALTVDLPEDMAKHLEEMAREENRSTSELFREAFRLYQLEVARKHIRAARGRAGNYSGRKESIQAYVDEIRSSRGRDKVA